MLDHTTPWLLQRLVPALDPIARPPGPSMLRAPWSLAAYFRDPLGFLASLSDTYGDVSFLSFAGLDYYLVNDPALIEELLVGRARSLKKDRLTGTLEEIVGHGLLTSEGTHWRRQRRLAAPPLQRRQIARYARMMADVSRDHARRLHGTLNIHHAMMALTLEIVVKALFRVDLPQEAMALGASFDVLFDKFERQQTSLWRFVPHVVPLPGSSRRRARQARAEPRDLRADRGAPTRRDRGR